MSDVDTNMRGEMKFSLFAYMDIRDGMLRSLSVRLSRVDFNMSGKIKRSLYVLLGSQHTG